MSTLEAARTIQDPVFGPCDSRRFGKSLDVNPLPPGSRFCNFDCIYCECATGSWPIQWDLRPQFPSAERIREGLALAAERIAPEELDSITIAGNGEPALAPELDAIVDVVTEARDRDWPQARTVILTNGTMCHKKTVRSALAKLDQRIVKLDAGTNWMLEQLNRPAAKLSIIELLRRISMMPEIVIQSMFVHGPVDNTGPHDVQEWCRWLAQLAPLSIQIYSLARTPAQKAGPGLCGTANSKQFRLTFNRSSESKLKYFKDKPMKSTKLLMADHEIILEALHVLEAIKGEIERGKRMDKDDIRSF